VLECSIRTLPEIKAVIEELLNKSACVQMLYSARMSKEEAMMELGNFVPHIANFMDMYVQDLGHTTEPTLQRQNERHNTEKYNRTICGIHDIEENIWVPELGLKGKVDVTVEVKINKRQKDLTKVSKNVAHVRWVPLPSQHSTSLGWGWRVAANIFDKQPWTDDKG
jgi:DNA replication ATP-dependent helicase Dna2